YAQLPAAGAGVAVRIGSRPDDLHGAQGLWLNGLPECKSPRPVSRARAAYRWSVSPMGRDHLSGLEASGRLPRPADALLLAVAFGSGLHRIEGPCGLAVASRLAAPAPSALGTVTARRAFRPRAAGCLDRDTGQLFNGDQKTVIRSEEHTSELQ